MFVLVMIARLTLRLGWEAAVDGSTRLSKVQGVNTSYAIPGLPNLPNLPDVDVPNVPDVDVPTRNIVTVMTEAAMALALVFLTLTALTPMSATTAMTQHPALI
jgi:hypothetical protein